MAELKFGAVVVSGSGEAGALASPEAPTSTGSDMRLLDQGLKIFRAGQPEEIVGIKGIALDFHAGSRFGHIPFSEKSLSASSPRRSATRLIRWCFTSPIMAKLLICRALVRASLDVSKAHDSRVVRGGGYD